MDKQQVAVIVPFYKEDLSILEQISLTQLIKTLSAYPIIAVKPAHLDLSAITPTVSFTEVLSFDAHYFESVQGYNELMLSPLFYERFLSYQFILLHQLDAFVFRDELAYWCRQGYDYIGAPWLKRLPSPDVVKALKTKLITRYHQIVNTYENGLPSDRQFDNIVGNGGFSLRHVSRFYHLAVKFSDKTAEYNKRTEHQFHEDVFWSIEVNRKRRMLKIPTFKKALRFSFENRLEISMNYSEGHIPFGCHAWDKHLDFWRPHFDKLGYVLPASYQP